MLHRQINFDAGIREREERHHHKRREIVQRSFEPKDGCGHTFARALKRNNASCCPLLVKTRKSPVSLRSKSPSSERASRENSTALIRVFVGIVNASATPAIVACTPEA